MYFVVTVSTTYVDASASAITSRHHDAMRRDASVAHRRTATQV